MRRSVLTVGRFQVPFLVLWLLAPAWTATAQEAPEGAPAQKTEPTTTSAEAPAEPERPYQGEPLQWQPHWTRFGTGHLVLSISSASLVVAKFLHGPLRSKRRGGVWFDEDVRSALRLESLSDQLLAQDVSDVLLTTLVTYPFFDALVIAGWYRNSPLVGAEIALISAEVFAVTAAIQSLLNVGASRERPYGRECGTDRPETSRDCTTQTRFYSFFSGHTSQAFAAAAVSCMHHANLPLYGGGTSDAVACATGFVAAGATGTLRILGDQHYASDVIVGAAVGTLTGLGLPWLLHYHGAPDAPAESSDVQLFLIPTPTGASMFGSFP